MRSEGYKKNLVSKYINNKCTPEELEEFFHLMENSALDDILEKFIDEDALNKLYNDRKVDSAISEELFKKVTRHKENKKSSPLFKRINYKIAAAAMTAFLVIGALFYIWRLQPSEVTLQTVYGETTTYTLPDQSRVILNGNSKLTYSENWTVDKPREVHLKGEAFFEVEPGKNNAPFIVHTGANLDVRVLGTKFNVEHRENNTQVVLNEGKVKLNMVNTRKSLEPVNLFMKPGELVEFSADSQKLIKKKVNPNVYTSWRHNQLVFKETPIREIFNTLENSQGYKVNLQDSTFLNESFTATYPADNIDILLEALEKSFGFSIMKREDKILTIKKD